MKAIRLLLIASRLGCFSFFSFRNWSLKYVSDDWYLRLVFHDMSVHWIFRLNIWNNLYLSLNYCTSKGLYFVWVLDHRSPVLFRKVMYPTSTDLHKRLISCPLTTHRTSFGEPHTLTFFICKRNCYKLQGEHTQTMTLQTAMAASLDKWIIEILTPKECTLYWKNKENVRFMGWHQKYLRSWKYGTQTHFLCVKRLDLNKGNQKRPLKSWGSVAPHVSLGIIYTGDKHPSNDTESRSCHPKSKAWQLVSNKQDQSSQAPFKIKTWKETYVINLKSIRSSNPLLSEPQTDCLVVSQPKYSIWETLPWKMQNKSKVS